MGMKAVAIGQNYSQRGLNPGTLAVLDASGTRRGLRYNSNTFGNSFHLWYSYTIGCHYRRDQSGLMQQIHEKPEVYSQTRRVGELGKGLHVGETPASPAENGCLLNPNPHAVTVQ